MLARPFPVLATVAGAGAALAGLAALSVVAVVGWFLADAGAHGDTRDALRVAADAWLVGQGSQLTYAGVTYAVVPLGLTALLALVLWRSARWAVGLAEPRDERETAYGVAMFSLAYLLVAVVVAVLATTDDAAPSLVRVVIGSLLLPVVVGGASVLHATQRWSIVTDRLPGDVGTVEAVVRVAGLAGRVLLAVYAAGLVTVLVSLGLHAGSLSAMLAAQDLSVGDLLALTVLSVVVLPNAALLAVGYLAGPGFAVGTGTTVSTGSVLLGPVPAFPLLAALPGSGAAPWWTDLLLAVPPVVTAAVVVRRHRRAVPGTLDWRHGLAAGAVAGLVLGLLSGLGGGALGDGRMGQLGTSPLLVAMFLLLSTGAGGLVGGVLAPLASRVLDLVGVSRPEVPVPAAEAGEGPQTQTAISPALAARLREARRQRADGATEQRPPFAPADAAAADGEVTVSLADATDDAEETVSLGGNDRDQDMA
ncbi:hypothetical protein GCM10011519_32190 [Marmoricola endophyticus]|uniref:Uncharacterized protein n=1 Tax=Marmoricola endophyticus TaxID=2040280 RepID=A0A917F9N5_9ACTN|nr:hypothetical protein GCM10011519_32190 [Marmoricola endophyticus]